MRQAELPIRWRSSGGSVIAGMALLLCVSAAGVASAADAGQPLLRCDVSLMNDDPRKLEFGATTDPYTVKAVDIHGRYRFKAVMVGERPVAYVKLYVYYHKDNRYILLHEAKYLAPAPNRDAANPFTGTQYVYSPNLERELRYSCSLTEASS